MKNFLKPNDISANPLGVGVRVLINYKCKDTLAALALHACSPNTLPLLKQEE